MTGVEILSQNNVYNVLLPEWAVAILLIVFVFFGVGCGIGLLHDKPFVIIICSIGPFVSFILAASGDTINPNSLDYIEYKVIVDDSVSMVEFSNKYEILGQDGRIYIVRERDN